MAIMGAVGYELLSARYFSIDLQGRLINGAYKGIDNTVTGATIGVGVNWDRAFVSSRAAPTGAVRIFGATSRRGRTRPSSPRTTRSTCRSIRRR